MEDWDQFYFCPNTGKRGGMSCLMGKIPDVLCLHDLISWSLLMISNMPAGFARRQVSPPKWIYEEDGFDREGNGSITGIIW